MKKIEEYDNFLTKVNFSYSDAINMISAIVYEEGDILDKIKSVEDDESLPKFVYPFYEFIKFKQRIPTIQEFWKLYYKLRPKNKKYFNETTVYVEGTLVFEALKYRISKTYPSLVREFLCILAAKEKFIDYKVIYNTELDIYGGIDFLLKKDKYYGIKLYINTKESIYYAEKKLNRHNDFHYENVEYISLPFNMNTDKLTVGNFYLYTDTDLDKLLELINTQ